MKTTGIIIFFAISITGCKGQHKANEDFSAERTSSTASFIVDETIDKLFPLFGAFEERKWISTWNPILIYPDKEIIEEGTTFKIYPHGHGHSSEKEFLWIVSKYEPENYLIQYLVSTENRFWTITVKSNPIENNIKTENTVTYVFTGLNAKGNKLNKENLDNMYKNELRDWAEMINEYFLKLITINNNYWKHRHYSIDGFGV